LILIIFGLITCDLPRNSFLVFLILRCLWQGYSLCKITIVLKYFALLALFFFSTPFHYLLKKMEIHEILLTFAIITPINRICYI